MLAAAFPHVGIGLLGVALAFGLTVLSMAYAVGHISGGHFNPAVTAGVVAAGRMSMATAAGAFTTLAVLAGAVHRWLEPAD